MMIQVCCSGSPRVAGISWVRRSCSKKVIVSATHARSAFLRAITNISGSLSDQKMTNGLSG